MGEINFSPLTFKERLLIEYGWKVHCYNVRFKCLQRVVIIYPQYGKKRKKTKGEKRILLP
jgi:hypothetical protein